ncbi:MAG: QueT transporter family protein [Hyphomonadaceae bacterium]|nr:QueT transporter family protein [Clostridia bacterium]
MKNLKFMLHAAIIAAVYAVLTIQLAPISYGPLQVRVSEALTVLPLFTPAAIPGLTIGCLIANIGGPNGLLDIVFGTLATLLAAVVSYLLRKNKMLVPLPPVLFNAVIVGGLLFFTLSKTGDATPLPLFMLWVGLGELIACYVIGFPLMKALEKYKRIFEIK